MTIQSYENTVRLMNRKVATLELDIRQSIDDALNQTRGDDTYIDGVVSEANLPDFRNNIITSLEEKLNSYASFNLEGADVLDRARQMTAYYGFASSDIHDLIDSLGSNVSYNNLYNPLVNGMEHEGRRIPPLIETVLRVMRGTCAEELRGHGQEVVEYTQTQDRVDPAKLTNTRDMVELIELYKAQEMIGARDLIGKNYLVDNFNPAAALEAETNE